MNLRENDQKFVAAISNEHIRAADAGENGADDFFEGDVANRMTVCVVDFFEMIDVDHRHAVLALQGGALILKILAAIRAGERVGIEIAPVFFEQYLFPVRIEPDAHVGAGNQLQHERASLDDDGFGDDLIDAGLGQFELDDAVFVGKGFAARAVAAGLFSPPDRVAGALAALERAVFIQLVNAMVFRGDEANLVKIELQFL